MTYFNKTIGGIVVWYHHTNCIVMCCYWRQQRWRCQYIYQRHQWVNDIAHYSHYYSHYHYYYHYHSKDNYYVMNYFIIYVLTTTKILLSKFSKQTATTQQFLVLLSVSGSGLGSVSVSVLVVWHCGFNCIVVFATMTSTAMTALIILLTLWWIYRCLRWTMATVVVVQIFEANSSESCVGFDRIY